MKKKHFVFGDSGHAKVVLDILFSNEIVVETIVDDHPKGKALFNIPVSATADFTFGQGTSFIIAIGNNSMRKKIAEQHNFSFFKAIHTSAHFSKFATLGEGTVVMPLAVVNAGTRLGKHCIINSGSVVEHDCTLADYVHISPNAAVAGNVSIGEGTQIGIGAYVIQGLTIGKWATIGAGAVIINDVPDYAVVVGNPGKIIKYHEK